MVGRLRDFHIFLVVLVACAACDLRYTFALGTSREAQIAGFIYASLQTIIVGEFAGRRISQVDAPPVRPVCGPNDFEDLRAAAKDNTAFDAFHRRCKFVEFKVNDTHVVGTAHLPSGYCETLKQAYDKMLAEHVYASTSHVVEFEYKGSRYSSTSGNLARGRQPQTKCNDDGSLSVSALRNRSKT